MSGECDKCGQHTLECFCRKHIGGPNDHFFYEGKFFETEDEFWAYVKEFSLRQTRVEDFNDLFDLLKRDVWMNLSMRKSQITNSDLRDILEQTLCLILEKIWEKDESVQKGIHGMD